MRKRNADVLLEKQWKINELFERSELIEGALIKVLKRNLTPELLKESVENWDITIEQYNGSCEYLWYNK